jgi:phage terminase large subunit-like protein
VAVAVKTELKPFTIAHFLEWVDQNELTLEDDRDWVVEPFQQDILADIFSGFREIWAIIPEGNAKTTLFGGTALYMADHSPSPWIPIGAASRDQAEILFSQAGGFVERSSSLKERFRVYDGYRKIKCANGGRGIKVYASDKDTGDGVIPFPIALVDEPHRHKDMGLYRLWKGKLGKRGAQIATFSTAGEPGSEFEEMRENIRNKAVKRKRDGSHLRAEGKNLVYHEWMVPRVEDAKDLEVVKQANPLEHITIEYLQEKLESETLDFGQDWLRLTCNIPTRSSMAAIPEKDWDECETDERIPPGTRIALGADFAWLEDTTALVPLWFRDPTFRLFGDPVVLEPPRDGTMLDVEEVKSAFVEINDVYPIEMIVADRSKAEDLLQWAEKKFGCIVIDREQTNDWATRDYDAFMEGIRERWIFHTGDRTFRRHALDAIRSRLSGDRYRFDRPRTQRKSVSRQKRIVIDALTAAAMVHSTLASRPVGDFLLDVEDLAAA